MAKELILLLTTESEEEQRNNGSHGLHCKEHRNVDIK